MNEVKGILEIVKVGGKQEGSLMKRETVTFDSVESLRKIDEVLFAMNQLIGEDCHVAVIAPRISVKKENDNVLNWQFETTPEEVMCARDSHLNGFVIHKTAEQLEKMTNPVNDMHDKERLCLLQCLILDMIRMPDPQITNPNEKRISFARELALKLDRVEFMMTLDELVRHIGMGTPGLYSIFDRPVEEGGLLGIRNLHGLSMKFYDKSMAFKLEASTRMKAGFSIFEDIGERYAKTGNAEMRV